MIKFYYNLAPNPDEGGALPRGNGAALRAGAGRYPQGRPVRSPAFLAINPNAKTPAITDDGAPVFDSNAILLYFGREDRPVPAGEHAAGARPAAVLDDVRRLRHRAVMPARRCISSTMRPEPMPTPSAATRSRRSAISASSTSGSPISGTCWATPTRSWTWRCGAWARLVPFVLGQEVAAKMTNLTRLVDEVTARRRRSGRWR